MGTLSLGFAVSALAIFAVVSLAGEALFGWLHRTPAPSLVAAAALAALALVDLGAFGLHTPMWRRQTPKQLFHRFGPSAGALLWGLDTGLVVTTFRVTSLSWAALALAALGLVPWWSGLLYAIGFTVPAAALVLAVPAHPWSPEDLQEPVWLQYRIMALEPAMRRVALLALLAGAATAGALTVWGMA
ncbi:MAG: hypothetical protein E6J00_01205 [Chloroflexi bacterium]|nr:MAG: hypothetical protein E6J00_01205 [Chloroflexota bacterium]